jgi:hypothetical protein
MRESRCGCGPSRNVLGRVLITNRLAPITGPITSARPIRASSAGLFTQVEVSLWRR